MYITCALLQQFNSIMTARSSTKTHTHIITTCIEHVLSLFPLACFYVSMCVCVNLSSIQDTDNNHGANSPGAFNALEMTAWFLVVILLLLLLGDRSTNNMIFGAYRFYFCSHPLNIWQMIPSIDPCLVQLHQINGYFMFTVANF